MVTEKTKFLTHQNAGTLNRKVVLNYIKNNMPVSRTDIWEKIGLSRASVTQIVKQLIEQGFVRETGTGESRGGRKPSYLEFNADSRSILVFDWHLKKLFLCDLNSEIISSRSVSINNDDPREFALKLKKASEAIVNDRGKELSSVIGLGLIMPGMVDPVNGIVILSVDQSWENIPLAGIVEEVTGISTTLETEGNMLALGEFLYGIGCRTNDFVLLDIEDDGIGSALILDGKIQRGSNNMSGEIGHTFFDANGPKCSCGRQGCLEASLKAVLRKKNRNWTKEASDLIGIAASTLINVLDPKIVVLSGSVIDKGDTDLISGIRSAAMEKVLGSEKRDIMIEKSSLGQFAGIKGICGLIYEKTIFMLK